MRRLDWIAVIILVVLALGGQLLDFGSSVPENANPRRPAPKHFAGDLWDRETRAWLSAAPARQRPDPFLSNLPREGVIESDGKRQPSVGSAVSASRKGVWLTARHVVEGCSRVGIQVKARRLMPATKVHIHPSADVAIIQTRGGPEALSLSRRGDGAREAYNIGFPAGQPGAVHARYMGSVNIRHVNRANRARSYRERVNAWLERSRIPDRSGSLGGLSGGAVLDDRGHIIGVVQAESRRRGRIMTARPDTLASMFRHANLPYPPASGADALKLTAKGYPSAARDLITSLRVAKVICNVN